MIEVSIKLICTRKPGTLSRIIRDIKLFGLNYQSHSIDYQAEKCMITVNSSGELNCTRDRLIELFKEFPEVVQVQELSISRDGEEISHYRTSVSEAHIASEEPLSPALLLSAEKRMSEMMGPVASFLVETAAQSSRNAGELYLKLSEELSDLEERGKFLSIIENVKPVK